MQELKIEYISLNKIKPYNKNPRKHPKASIDAIMESIKDFEMCDPIAVWGKDNTIVEGHGRLQALKKLGYKEAPIIRLDHLTDEQRRAYISVHNKTQEFSEWDFDLLPDELNNIFDIDMSKFGFELTKEEFGLGLEPEQEQEEEDEIDEGYYGDERERTNNAYNLSIIEYDNLTNDFWQMPILKPCDYIPKELISFNYAKTSERKDVGVHFCIDDYQFERVWNNPEKYLPILMEYECIMTPDFSLYMDMPMPMKIWNTYRARMIGNYYQSKGLRVIPTISWCEPETFSFVFKGLPQNGTVLLSTIGIKNDLTVFKQGYPEFIKQVQPKNILLYGGKIDYDFGDVNIIYFENQAIERLSKGAKKDEN